MCLEDRIINSFRGGWKVEEEVVVVVVVVMRGGDDGVWGWGG